MDRTGRSRRDCLVEDDFSLIRSFLAELRCFSMVIDDFRVFWTLLIEIWKLFDWLFIRESKSTPLNDFDEEAKDIDSNIVVLPALLCPKIILRDLHGLNWINLMDLKLIRPMFVINTSHTHRHNYVFTRRVIRVSRN